MRKSGKSSGKKLVGLKPGLFACLLQAGRCTTNNAIREEALRNEM